MLNTKPPHGAVFWKVLLLLIFYNPLFMVMSLFTFSAPLCKCHYSMLSDDNNNNIKTKTKKERFLNNESIQHVCQAAERERVTFRLSGRSLVSLFPLVNKNKSKQKQSLKAGLSVKWISVELSVLLAIKTPHTPLEKLLLFNKRTGVLVLPWVLNPPYLTK